MWRFKTSVEIDYKKIKEQLERQLKSEAEEAVNLWARAAEQAAKESVAPGVGPGPHPHRTEHEDTGLLMSSIRIFQEPTWAGNEITCILGTEVPYGYDLEMGWIVPESGNVYRYPWLYPSTMSALYTTLALLKQKKYMIVNIARWKVAYLTGTDALPMAGGLMIKGTP